MSKSLDDGSRYAGWSLSLYPDAAEAGGCFVSSRRRTYTGVRGFAADPERAQAEAGRRSRSRLRRYCAAHRLNRLGTLTYGPPFCTDPVQVRRDVGRFFRRLRDGLGGAPLPYVWVPELHKDGKRFHLHFAVGQFVPRQLIASAWGHGFVHIKLLGDLPVGSGSLAEARLAAVYLSKYVTKGFDTDLKGLHRFDRAQGFTPQVVRFRGPTADEVLDQAVAQMGAAPSTRWNSDQELEWRGAPAIWVAWS